jgi:hypothetical protein
MRGLCVIADFAFLGLLAALLTTAWLDAARDRNQYRGGPAYSGAATPSRTRRWNLARRRNWLSGHFLRFAGVFLDAAPFAEVFVAADFAATFFAGARPTGF